MEYSFRLFPLGGYVAFPDDDPNNSKYPADDPNLLKNRSIPARTAVISAGIIANFIFAYLVLLLQVGGICMCCLFGQMQCATASYLNQPPLTGHRLDTQQHVRISTDSCSTVKVTLLALNTGGAPLVHVLHSCYGATHSATKSCSC